MSSPKPGNRPSSAVSKMLEHKRFSAIRRKRKVGSKMSREGWTLAKVNDAVEKDLKTTASRAANDPAFRLFVRTALNGDTNKVTGWQTQPAEA